MVLNQIKFSFFAPEENSPKERKTFMKANVRKCNETKWKLFLISRSFSPRTVKLCWLLCSSLVVIFNYKIIHSSNDLRKLLPSPRSAILCGLDKETKLLENHFTAWTIFRNCFDLKVTQKSSIVALINDTSKPVMDSIRLRFDIAMTFIFVSCWNVKWMGDWSHSALQFFLSRIFRDFQLSWWSMFPFCH